MLSPSHPSPSSSSPRLSSRRRSYLDKQVLLSLNKNRKVTGTLRGYDQFMNIVLADASEETVGAGGAAGGSSSAGGNASTSIGMVVRFSLGQHVDLNVFRESLHLH